MNPIGRAQGFWAMAHEYRQAAEVLFVMSAEMRRPSLYLYCHAIELAFKSVLIFRGCAEKNLRNLGHDIDAAMIEVGRHNFSEVSRQVIERLGGYYGSKEFEYFFLKGATFGALDELPLCANEVLSFAFSEISEI